MIAYNRNSLDNLEVRKQVKEAYDADCISGEEKAKVDAAHPVEFFTPNIFICFGLFVLTVIIVSSVLGLLMLGGTTGDSYALLFLFFGLVCYAALEVLVRRRKDFKSGVDYGLIWMSAILIYSGVYLAFENLSASTYCLILLSISFLFALRFANLVMALISYTSLMFFIFYGVAEHSKNAQPLVAFLLMGVSAIAWFLAGLVIKRERFRHYRTSLSVIKTAALVSFYLAGNYFIVREMNTLNFDLFQRSGQTVPLGWLFWILTITVPIFYIYQGIRKKDSLFLWTGLALVAVSVFTIRYYYHVLPTEWAMIVGGLILTGLAYAVIKHLRTPKRGFTWKEKKTNQSLVNLNLESIVISATFTQQPSAPAANNEFQFGGGSGGGGGAGGEF